MLEWIGWLSSCVIYTRILVKTIYNQIKQRSALSLFLTLYTVSGLMGMWIQGLGEHPFGQYKLGWGVEV